MTSERTIIRLIDAHGELITEAMDIVGDSKSGVAVPEDKRRRYDELIMAVNKLQEVANHIKKAGLIRDGEEPDDD